MPPAFIVGAGRSGTTLLASMLNRHPLIAVPLETHYFMHLALRGGWDRLQRQSGPDGVRNFLEEVIARGELPLTPDAVLQGINPASLDGGQLFLHLVDRLTAAQTKRLWLEKTPRHLLYLTEIRRWFPDARLIHIIRDGRDVALSYLRMPWGSESYLENLAEWRRFMIAGDDLRRDNAAHTLFFEDLVQRPETELKAVCAFLGVQFAPVMLTPDGTERALMTERESWKSGVLDAVDPGQAQKWRKALDSRGQALALAVTGDWLRRLGYECPQVDERSGAECLRISRTVLLQAGPFWDRLASVFAKRGWSIEVSPRVDETVANIATRLAVLGTTRAFLDELPSRRPVRALPYILRLAWRIRRARRRGTLCVWVDGDDDGSVDWRLHRLACRLLGRSCDMVWQGGAGSRTPSAPPNRNNETDDSNDELASRLIALLDRGASESTT